MDALDDVDQLIKRYLLALDEFMKGKTEPVNKVWSHREDVTLANPSVGTPARGWEQVSETMEHGAAQRR